jgi:hypothetical protein
LGVVVDVGVVGNVGGVGNIGVDIDEYMDRLPS